MACTRYSTRTDNFQNQFVYGTGFMGTVQRHGDTLYIYDNYGTLIAAQGVKSVQSITIIPIEEEIFIPQQEKKKYQVIKKISCRKFHNNNYIKLNKRLMNPISNKLANI